MQNAVMPDEERDLVLAATAGRLHAKQRARRQVRCYLVAIVTLGVFTATLAAVNVVLSRRGAQPVVASSAPAATARSAAETPATPAAAVPAPPPPAKPAAPPAATPAPRALASASTTPPPAATPSRAAAPAASSAPVAAVTAASEPTANAPKPAVATRSPAVASKPDTSPVKRAVAVRNETAAAPVVRPATARGKMEPRAADAPDSGTRVARWLVERYGRSDAERQAAQAVTYYPASDERAEHWRKVLAHVRAINGD